MSINAKTRVMVAVNELLDSPENKSRGPIVHEIDVEDTWTDGTASTNIDIVWSDRRSVAASGTSTVDLGTGSAITDTFGTSFVPAVELVFICVRNRSSTAGDILHVGPHTTNGLTGPWVAAGDLVAVGPGDVYFQMADAGWTITDGSVDTIRIVETGTSNTVTFDILLGLRSA